MHERDLLEQYGEAFIVEKLTPLLTEERIARIDEVLSNMQSIVGRVRDQVAGDLHEGEKRRLRALYHLRTVGVETAKLVLKRGD